MIIGVLALQGGFALHLEKLHALNIETKRVVCEDDLKELHGLIIPGGESSTILRTAQSGLLQAIKEFAHSRPVWGVCAGCVLIASEVVNPEQMSLGLLDITVRRNAYGAQNESFIRRIDFGSPLGGDFECIFIRAPRITHVGKNETTVATDRDDPVMVENKLHMATTFHPELSDKLDFHRYFLRKIAM